MLRSYINKQILPHAIAGVLVLIAAAGVTELIVNLLEENQLERQRSAIVDKTAAMRAKIEGEINSFLFLSAGLMAFVASNPDVDEKEFSQIASEITVVGRNIRNIGLAKGNVITHIYPLAGNEAALGLDYKKVTSQWPAVSKAMELNSTTVAGPINLVQGGRGLIIRTPIYTRLGISGYLERQKPSYWGMASIVIDAPGFFQDSGFEDLQDEVVFALRGTNDLGKAGEMIMGNPDLFTLDSVISPITIPNGTWQIAGLPLGGWGEDSGSIWLLRFFGWLAAILFGLLITALSFAREINRGLALHDQLTKLPNRRLLEDRLDQAVAYSKRYGNSFCLCYVDLDGFKEINDKYGHETGDALLIEASKRMFASVRAIDTVARTGGDEFIILVNKISQESDILNIRSQLKNNLIGSAFICGHKVELRASMGVAVFPDDGASIDMLQQKADQRMYIEKQSKHEIESH